MRIARKQKPVQIPLVRACSESQILITSSKQIDAENVAKAFGYTEKELSSTTVNSSIPREANVGLSCRNPVATANIKAEVSQPLGTHPVLYITK